MESQLYWRYNMIYFTLARLVDFPTPLTPTNTTTYGFLCSLAACTSLSISIERLGVKIRIRASSIAAYINIFNYTISMNMLGTKNWNEKEKKGFYWLVRKEQKIGEKTLLQGFPLHKGLMLNLQMIRSPSLLSFFPYLYLINPSN